MSLQAVRRATPACVLALTFASVAPEGATVHVPRDGCCEYFIVVIDMANLRVLLTNLG